MTENIIFEMYGKTAFSVKNDNAHTVCLDETFILLLCLFKALYLRLVRILCTKLNFIHVCKRARFLKFLKELLLNHVFNSMSSLLFRGAKILSSSESKNLRKSRDFENR